MIYYLTGMISISLLAYVLMRGTKKGLSVHRHA